MISRDIWVSNRVIFNVRTGVRQRVLCRWIVALVFPLFFALQGCVAFVLFIQINPKFKCQHSHVFPPAVFLHHPILLYATNSLNSL